MDSNHTNDAPVFRISGEAKSNGPGADSERKDSIDFEIKGENQETDK